jgi:GH25 family lysozyme M1 (1,4-beta-N-acetylmuramidase)
MDVARTGPERTDTMNLPAHFNGVGLHDTPGAGTAAWGYSESLTHAQLLRAHGVTLYKILSDGANKTERCRAYVNAGIVPIVRPYVDKPWGRDPQSWLPPADIIKPYVDVGVQFFELGNEWNIECEWAIPYPGAAATIARFVVEAWQVILQRQSEVPGSIMLFPSNTPGGNTDHRACFLAIKAELSARGLLSTVQHAAIHPRPHNNPPDTVWSPTNTVCFDEWRWIRDNFQPSATYWVTEHGYSVGDSQNANYPPIDLNLHTEYNWELLKRLNPAHPKAIEPGLGGVMYWFEAGWGHWGAWPKDALRDSVVPEMPAPSPLWERMGAQASELAFSRYGDTPPPPDPPPDPPPADRAVGIDVSYCQDGIDEDTSGVNWTEAATHNSFAIIRCSIGETMDRCLYSHYNKAKAAGMLVGFYHYLSENYPGRQQARFVQALTNDLDFDLPVALDVEAQGLTKQQVMDFVARWKELTIEPLAIYTSRTAWNRIVGPGAQPWAAGCKLWVADARDVPAPALPDPWVSWEFWQYGVKAGQEFPTAIDRNRFRGTIADLQAAYGDWLVPPAPPTDIRVTYEPGGPYIVGTFKVADVWLLRYDAWDNPEQCLTGSKPEHGPAGFTFSAPNPGMYELTDGFTSWDVEARSGFTTRVVWA